MENNAPLSLGKFQLKMLKTIELHSLEIYLFLGILFVAALIIALAAFLYFPRQKKPILKKYPVILLSVGGVLSALSLYFFFNLKKLIISGFTFADFSPALFVFAGYFFLIYFALEKYISAKRGSYAENLRKNSLLLGIRNGDFGESAINPQFVHFDAKSLFGDFHVIGGKGSGKTTTFVIPPLQQILSDTSETRPTVFLIDAKGVLADMIDGMAHPRHDDIMIIGQNGISGNLLDMADPLLTANNLSLAFSNFQGGQVNEYYKNYQETFLRNSIQFLDFFTKRDRSLDCLDPKNQEHTYLISSGFFNFRTVTISEVYSWLSDFRLKEKFLAYFEEHKTDFPPQMIELARYFNKTLRDDESTLSGMISLISPLVSEKVKGFFADPKPFDFVDAIDRGKIIIVNVPEGSFGTLSKLIGLVLLLQMQKTALKRLDSSFKINRSRFIFIILDEVQKFMCSELANFPSVSRQAKVCNMYLHQSLGQIPHEYLDDLYGNTLNKVVLYVRDNQTAEYISANFGEKIVKKEVLSENKGGAASQGQVFGGGITSRGKSVHEEKERRFSAHDIIHLKRNKAIISMSDGQNIQESFLVDLLPFYMNDLFPIYHFIFGFSALDKAQLPKIKAILKNTANGVNAEFKRFSAGENAFYFMFAFKNPVKKEVVEQLFESMRKGLQKYETKAEGFKAEMFQGDLDTVIEKKSLTNII